MSTTKRLAALCGCVVVALAACAPTEPSPPPSSSPQVPFDVRAVIRQVRSSFQPGAEGFTGGQDTYAIRVAKDGAFQVTPFHHPQEKAGQPALTAAMSEPGARLEGAPVKVRTASMARGGRALASEARVSSREDGSVAMARGAVVEVLRNTEEGVEQLWELAAPPEGEGDLEVTVELAGLDYAGETEHGHHFVDPATGVGVRYGLVTWVDANGERTPVRAEYASGALVLRVPAEVLTGSAWPAVLDPLISPEFGVDVPVVKPAPGFQFGGSVAHANGVYLVVWSEFIGSTSPSGHVATRVRASDGQVLDKAGIRIAFSGYSAFQPTVASNGTNFFVFWSQGGGPTPGGVYGTRVRASDGAVLDAGGRLLLANANTPLNITSGSNGRDYLAVWDYGAGTDIHGVRVRGEDGAPLDAIPLRIGVGPTGQFYASIGSAGNDYLVVWTDDRQGATHQVRGSRVRGADGAVVDPQGLVIATTAERHSRLTVASEGTHYLVAWEDVRNDGGDVYGARVRVQDGAVMDPPGLPLATGPGTQELPVLSCASTRGTCLLVWVDTQTSGSRFLATRLRASDGARLDADRLLGPGSGQPFVTSNGEDFLVTWRVAPTGGTEFDILGMRVDGESGAPLDAAPVLLTFGPINRQVTPAVAAGGDVYLVVWSDNRNGNFDIYGTRVRAVDGQVLDTVALPISVKSLDQKAPAVAFDGSNFLVVWENHNTSFNVAIQGARVRASDGVVLDPSGRVFSSLASAARRTPAVAFGGGYFLLAWEHVPNSNIVVMRVRASDAIGMDAGGRFLTNDTFTQRVPSVAYANGHFLVAWEDHWRAGSPLGWWPGVLARRVRASDGLFVDSFALSPATPSFENEQPAVASNGQDGFLVVWRQNSFPTPSIQARRVSASTGTLLGLAPGVVGTDRWKKVGPSVASDGSRYLVTWYDQAASQLELRGRWLKLDATPANDSSMLLSEVNGTVLPTDTVAVASASTGRFLVAHERYDASQTVRVGVRLVEELPNGLACSQDAACASGFCVDGVCCDGACGGGAGNDCQACSVAAGGTTNGACTPVRADAAVVCRPSAVACDVAEVCDGTAPLCPADEPPPVEPDLSGDKCEDSPCDASHFIDALSEADLEQPFGQSLRVKVDHACSRWEAGDVGGAHHQLRALLNELRAQRGKKLSEAAAATLLPALEAMLAR